MGEWSWVLLGLGAVGVALGLLAWSPIRSVVREARLADARREFHRHREHLEAKFVALAGARVKPGSRRWADCEFDNDVAYVRDRSTRQLAALVAITISLEAPKGTSPSAAESGGFRAGTAVFRFKDARWDTDGQTLLNLSPAEAVRYYQDDLEVVAQEVAR